MLNEGKYEAAKLAVRHPGFCLTPHLVDLTPVRMFPAPI